jgi:hypothetical protein
MGFVDAAAGFRSRYSSLYPTAVSIAIRLPLM